MSLFLRAVPIARVLVVEVDSKDVGLRQLQLCVFYGTKCNERGRSLLVNCRSAQACGSSALLVGQEAAASPSPG